jgi:hypothetical protein
VVCAGAATVAANAQSCTTQAKMSAELRNTLSSAAMMLADEVKANDADKLQAATVPEYAQNFGPTGYVVRTTAANLTGDTLQVTQLYTLDARDRKAGDTSEADFTCALSGTTSEMDFGINGLPPGMYAFAMVEAKGGRPWLLAFLMRQTGTEWKMAGFYPRARMAAGHDGLWYWTTARTDAKAKQLWLAWLMYGEADELLRPANFVTSTNLDRLRSERRGSTPPELDNGISADTPLVVQGADGAEFRFTAMSAEGSEDGKRLNLVLHLKADWIDDPVAARARNTAAAKALLDKHKELRTGFDGVSVFAETAGHDPFLTQQTMVQLQ